MATLEDLRRRAQVMQWTRLAVAALVPLLMVLYVPPPGVTSELSPVRASVAVLVALLGITAASALATRRAVDPSMLVRWGRCEIGADVVVALGILQVFAFDQFSSMWTILLVVLLEAAFREGLRGVMTVWLGSGIVYAGMQVLAAQRYPETAPLDPGSILFRALVTGSVAFVAGSLASQLQSAVERHRASEVALAEQYADLRRIGRVSRAIAAGPEARNEVCRAVADLAGAGVVMLFEPRGDVLCGTAAAGCDETLLQTVSLDDSSSGTVRAYLTGALELVPDAVVPSAFPHLPLQLEAASCVFVPVVRDGTAVGALAITFGRRTERLTARVAAALEVLAEEAAVAIVRADLTATLANEARRDQLTGLVNRRGMEESLDTELQRSRRTGAPVTVLMLDLDGLKIFNDTYGHLAGDRLLAAAAAGWRGRLRPTDVLARYGGDEFVAVLPGCDEAAGMHVAQALLGALPPGARCSLGAATWDQHEQVGELLARADGALYAGKRAGGGCAVPAIGTVPMQRGEPAALNRRDAVSG